MPSELRRWSCRLPVAVRRRLVEPADLVDDDERLERLGDFAHGDEREAEALLAEDEHEIVFWELGEVHEEERAAPGAELDPLGLAKRNSSRGSVPEEGGTTVELVHDRLEMHGGQPWHSGRSCAP